MGSNNDGREHTVSNLKEERIDENARAKQTVFELATSWAIPAALGCVLKLDVPDILAAAGPDGAAMSAQEILTHMPQRSDHASPQNLERLLRMLACKGVFTEFSADAADCKPGAPDERRRFGLTPISRAMVRKQSGGTFGNFALFLQRKEYDGAKQFLSAAVLSSEEPFAKAHGGKHLYEYCGDNPAINKSFQATMSDETNRIMAALLDKYTGFKDVDRLVDVGGGLGTTLAGILERYPHIHGINFDLPHVLAHAPLITGVEHVAGDMFKSVPSGCDTAFFKMILHNWDDAHCVKVLQNCYKALPPNGKVIMVECLLPDKIPAQATSDDLCAFQFDMVMMLFTTGGRQRNIVQYRQLASEAGFNAKLQVTKLDFFAVIEAFK